MQRSPGQVPFPAKFTAWNGHTTCSRGFLPTGHVSSPSTAREQAPPSRYPSSTGSLLTEKHMKEQEDWNRTGVLHIGRCARMVRAAGMLLLGWAMLSVPAHAEEIATKLCKMTGARTKIVWIRSSGGQGHAFGPVVDKPRIWTIWVLDTDEGKERCLVSDKSAHCQTMITPSGKRVIWFDYADNTIWSINWDGIGKKEGHVRGNGTDRMRGSAWHRMGILWTGPGAGRIPGSLPGTTAFTS